MKTIAIMQPYFLPYLGYFQLISSVETFVVLDDVKLTKNSWINRNRLLIAGEARWLSVPITKEHGSVGAIRDHRYLLTESFWTKTKKTIESNYAKAAGQDLAIQLLTNWEQSGLDNVSLSNWLLVSQIMELLAIEPRQILFASEHQLGTGFRGQERIIRICKELESDCYVNLPGGRSLYDKDEFGKNGLALSFVEPDLFPYGQATNFFEPGLSVLDFLMNVGPDSGRLFNANKYSAKLGNSL